MKTFLFFITDKIDERTQLVIVKEENFDLAMHKVLDKLLIHVEGTAMRGYEVEGDFFVKEIMYANN